MKGDKETIKFLDFKTQEEKTKSEIGGYLLGGSLLSFISLINLTNINQTNTKIAPLTLSIVPLLGAIYCFTKSSLKKEELIYIKREIETVRHSLINMGLEDKNIYGKKY